MDDARVGAQLRAARLAARKSMAEVAEEAGLTKGFLSKLERDLANVSVASLIRLCDALGVSVGSLFQPSKGEVVRADERPTINFGGTGIKEYLLTPVHERRVQAILSDLEPGGGSGDEPYALPADVELVFILAGRPGLRPDPGAVGGVPRAAGHGPLPAMTADMDDVLLIHGGLWEDVGADWFWRRTGVVDGLAGRGLTVVAPDRLRRAPSWRAG